MSSAGFILGINLFTAGLLATAFLALAIYQPHRYAARWLVLSYVCGMLYFAGEFLTPLAPNPAPIYVLTFAMLLAATAFINAGVASEYRVPIPSIAIAICFGVSIVGVAFTAASPRNDLWRNIAYQLPCAVMQLSAAWLVWSARMRRPIDLAVILVFVASALQFLSKPALVLVFGATQDAERLYMQSTYALVSQSLGTVFGMAVALMMLGLLVRGVLVDATTRSETDGLSGLLNRGAFEMRARQMLDEADRDHATVALVICDLDHFKTINDTFGHAAGDRVIVAFADFLRASVEPRHCVARIGGEEFAVLLAHTNVVAARLFAEGVRGGFSGLAFAGLPPERRFTASFGVAEHGRGEGIGSLLARADKALYLAKNSGRDCVKMAPRPELRVQPLASAAIRMR